jgi:transposase-like protein
MRPAASTTSRSRRPAWKNVSRKRPSSSPMPRSHRLVITPLRSSSGTRDGSRPRPSPRNDASIWIVPSWISISGMVIWHRRVNLGSVARDGQSRSCPVVPVQAPPFPVAIILLYVRWYCKYEIGYRDLAEMMRERGVSVNQSTIFRWVQRYALEAETRVRPYQGPRSGSWRVDETYVRVGGKWKYLFRAVDKHGQLIASMLSDRRNTNATYRFLRKALEAMSQYPPSSITTDKLASYPNLVRTIALAECSSWPRPKNRQLGANTSSTTALLCAETTSARGHFGGCDTTPMPYATVAPGKECAMPRLGSSATWLSLREAWTSVSRRSGPDGT